MKSSRAKVLHEIAGLSLIGHVLRVAQSLSFTQIIPVIAPGADEVREVCAPHVCAVQEISRGTGDAVAAGMRVLNSAIKSVLVLTGDAPLIRTEMLQELLSAHEAQKNIVTILTMTPGNPTGYGRIVTDAHGAFQRIVEEKDASADEKRIGVVNSGVMVFAADALQKYLKQLQPKNAQGEYYLTDIPVLVHAGGGRVGLSHGTFDDLRGINDRAQLAEAEALMQARIRTAHMLTGVTLLDPVSVYFCFDTKIAPDVVIEPQVIFGPGVTIESGAIIRGFSHIEGTIIGAGAIIGPFARVRPGTHIGAQAKIGNFVEVKKSILGTGAKVNHLTYIGDSTIGAKANIGAGTVTCNYDGFNKHKTQIGAGAFVGSNSTLVAPVFIHDGAFVAAGSVITSDVPEDALAFARTKQLNKSGWARAFREKFKKKG